MELENTATDLPEENAEQAENQYRNTQKNFWGSLVLLLFALAYFTQAFRIQNISTAQWYDAPSLFPIIIGGAFVAFCVVYMLQNRAGYRITAEDREAIAGYLKSSVFIRLVLAILFLAVYIFGLLGLRIGSFKLPYEAATFLYLFVNMVVFRTNKYAIWKIVVISLAVSLIVGFGFSQGAKIPLP